MHEPQQTNDGGQAVTNPPTNPPVSSGAGGATQLGNHSSYERVMSGESVAYGGAGTPPLLGWDADARRVSSSSRTTSERVPSTARTISRVASPGDEAGRGDEDGAGERAVREGHVQEAPAVGAVLGVDVPGTEEREKGPGWGQEERGQVVDVSKLVQEVAGLPERRSGEEVGKGDPTEEAAGRAEEAAMEQVWMCQGYVMLKRAL